MEKEIHSSQRRGKSPRSLAPTKTEFTSTLESSSYHQHQGNQQQHHHHHHHHHYTTNNNDYGAHMEKYRLVQEHKSEESDEFLATQTSGNLPEVRITQQGKPRNYISYAMNLFESGQVSIVLKAMGRAINKAVTIAEILKRKMPLHQWNNVSSVEMIDVYEPVEEGLDVVTSRRYVSCMQITLSLTLTQADDVQHPGYQPPLSEDEMHQQTIPPMSSPGPHHHHHQQQPPQPPPPGGMGGPAPPSAGAPGTLIATP